MQNQYYNHVNQNEKNDDYYNRSSATSSNSSSTTTTTTIGRNTETTTANSQTTINGFRLMITQMFMEHFVQDYQDAIGTRPVQVIIKEVREQLERGEITPQQVSRALQQTAYAPRPSWAYARAIIRRMVRDGEFTENDVPF